METVDIGGPPDGQPARIVAVAIIFGTRVWQMPAPARHHDIILKRHAMGLRGSGEQGFVDSNGQFWGRRHAMYVAREAGQLLPRPANRPYEPHGDLFSEDVW